MSSSDKAAKWRTASGRATRAAVTHTPKTTPLPEETKGQSRAAPLGIPIDIEEFRRLKEKARTDVVTPPNAQEDSSTTDEGNE